MSLQNDLREHGGHVAFSVGWLGAVAVFLVLGVICFTSEDARVLRGAYLVMEPTA